MGSSRVAVIGEGIHQLLFDRRILKGVDFVKFVFANIIGFLQLLFDQRRLLFTQKLAGKCLGPISPVSLFIDNVQAAQLFLAILINIMALCQDQSFVVLNCSTVRIDRVGAILYRFEHRSIGAFTERLGSFRLLRIVDHVVAFRNIIRIDGHAFHIVRPVRRIAVRRNRHTNLCVQRLTK